MVILHGTRSEIKLTDRHAHAALLETLKRLRGTTTRFR